MTDARHSANAEQSAPPVVLDAAQKALVSELGQAMGLSAFAFGPEGGCALTFEGNLTTSLQFRPQDDRLWLYGDLGAPAAGAAAYLGLLQSNLFSAASLALSGDAPPRVVLQQPLAWRGKRGHELLNDISAFVEIARSWQAYLSAERPTEAAPSEGPTQLPDNTTMIRI